jgi:hypothetical protein
MPNVPAMLDRSHTPSDSSPSFLNEPSMTINREPSSPSAGSTQYETYSNYGVTFHSRAVFGHHPT